MDSKAIVNALRVFILDILSYFNVNCQESSKLFWPRSYIQQRVQDANFWKRDRSFLAKQHICFEVMCFNDSSLLLHFIWGFKYWFHPVQPLTPLLQAALIQWCILAPWPSQWPLQKQLCILLWCKSSQTSRTCSFWHPALQMNTLRRFIMKGEWRGIIAQHSSLAYG